MQASHHERLKFRQQGEGSRPARTLNLPDHGNNPRLRASALRLRAQCSLSYVPLVSEARLIASVRAQSALRVISLGITSPPPRPSTGARRPAHRSARQWRFPYPRSLDLVSSSLSPRPCSSLRLDNKHASEKCPAGMRRVARGQRARRCHFATLFRRPSCSASSARSPSGLAQAILRPRPPPPTSQ